MNPETAVLMSMGIPMMGAPLIGLFGRYPNLRETVTLVTAGLLFIAVASLLPEVMAGARPGITLIETLPGLPIRLEVEPLGMIFAAVASFLWIVNSIYSIGYMRGHNEINQTRYYICFALALFGTMGVAFAANMMTLFIFYEVLTLSTYPLVTHKGDRKSVMAGRTYLGILLCTSIGIQLFAIIWTWTATGTLDFTPGGILAGKVEGPEVGLLLFLYIYGIGKAALMPAHRWLPAAMVAPTPVSALLHAVAVVKAGVFSVVKVVVYIFGLDSPEQRGEHERTALCGGRHNFDRLHNRAAPGQPEASSRLFDCEPTFLHRAWRRTGDELGGRRRRLAPCDARLRQDHPVLLRWRDHGGQPQNRDQPDARHRPNHAAYHFGLPDRQPQHYRPAALRRHVGQVGTSCWDRLTLVSWQWWRCS